MANKTTTILLLALTVGATAQATITIEAIFNPNINSYINHPVVMAFYYLMIFMTLGYAGVTIYLYTGYKNIQR